MKRKITLRIDNRDIDVFRVNNDVNGNPRYIVHYLNIADNFPAALQIARKIGGKKYRAKWYGGGIVFQSYNVAEDLKQIIKV